jgi:DNA invertase Pin-like site-specific DNA recombinase
VTVAELAPSHPLATPAAPRILAILYLRLSDLREADLNEDGTGKTFADREQKLRELAARLSWGVFKVIVENDLPRTPKGKTRTGKGKARPASAFKRVKVTMPDGATAMRVWRPGFREVLDHLTAGRAHALLAEDLDRVMRDPRDLEDFIDVVEPRKLNARSLAGSLTITDGGTDSEITMARLMVAVANKSSRDTSRRVAAGRERKVINGEYGGGPRPFGYEADGLTLRPSEAAVIEECSQRVLQIDQRTGKLTALRSLARELRTAVDAADQAEAVLADLRSAVERRNAALADVRDTLRQHEAGQADLTAVVEAAEVFEGADVVAGADAIERQEALVAHLRIKGVPTANGQPWTAAALRWALLRPRNCGIRVFRGEEWGPAPWPAIIPEDTFRAVQGLLTDPSRKSGPGAAPRWLGSGIYLCGECKDGTTCLVSGGRNHQPRYKCRAAWHITRNAAAVDDMVIKAIVRRLLRPDAVDLIPVTDDGVDIPALRAEAAAIRRNLNEMAEDRALGLIDRGQMLRATAKANTRLAEIDEVLAAYVPSPLVPLLGAEDVRAAWDAQPLSIKRAVLDTLFTVTILPMGQQGSGFNPSTVDIRPKLAA